MASLHFYSYPKFKQESTDTFCTLSDFHKANVPKKTTCKAKLLLPEQWTGTSVLCRITACSARLALLMQPCMTHYRVAATVCFAAVSLFFFFLFHQLNPSLQFCHTLKESCSMEQARRPFPAHDWSFFIKLLTFEGIPVSAGAASP